MIGPIPFDQTKSAPNTLVLVDLREDIEIFLQAFEKVCAGRARLTWTEQLPAFFALLLFGVAKSILIDAYVQRGSYEDPTPWTGNMPLKMSSAYKALVSVFCWASKSDTIIDVDKEEDIHGISVREEVIDLVNFKSWSSIGCNSTKSFLLSLGTYLLPDGSFSTIRFPLLCCPLY